MDLLPGVSRPALLALLVALPGLGVRPALAVEVFVAPAAVEGCPCGRGTPPPAPCGADRAHPLACWEDARARAAEPGDTVTFLEGTHETCLDLTRSGRRSSPITYRADPPGGATIHCAGAADAVRLGGRFIVVDGLRIMTASPRGTGVRLDGAATPDTGSNILRRLEIAGARIGVSLRDAGRNLLEDITIRDAGSGLQVAGTGNVIRRMTIHDTAAEAVWIGAGAAASETLIEGGRIEHAGTSALIVDAGAGRTTISDVVMIGTGHTAVEVKGPRTTLRRCEVARSQVHGIEVLPLPVPVDQLLIEDCDIHDNSGTENGVMVGDGVKMESVRRAVIRGSRIHDNANNGILEGGSAVATTIEDCEIDHNGHSRLAHGLYAKGTGGVLRSSRVHDNAGYGVHLWAAPRRYLVVDNEVYDNGVAGGGGIVIGGTPTEAPPGRSGLPEQVVARRNHLWGNRGAGLYYLLPRGTPGHPCPEGTEGNAFLDNDVETPPGSQGIVIVGAPDACVTLKGNTIRPAAAGGPPPPGRGSSAPR